MSDHDLAFWTFVCTVLALGAAIIGIVYAIKTLQAGNDTLRLAAEESREATKVARAQFWVMLRGVFANYDDVHVRLRPGGEWASTNNEPSTGKGPVDAAEWGRVELYMGLFEFCEKLLESGLLDEHDFGEAYRYRLQNIVQNHIIVREKLMTRTASWKSFIRICDRYDVEISVPAQSPIAGK